MLRRLVPAVVVAVLLVTSPIVAVTAAAPPDSGSGGGAAGEAGGASGSASGSVSAGGSGSSSAPNGTRTISGTGGIIDAAPAADGGRYLVGATGLQAPNTTVSRVGPNGTVQWQRTFGATGEPRRAVGVVSGDRPGAYLLEVVGSQQSPPGEGEALPQLRLSRLDAEGEVLWNRSLGNVTTVYRPPNMVTSGDGVVLARAVDGEPPATRLTRFTASGSVDWDRTYTGGTPRALAGTPDGGLLVAGEHDYRQGWLLRLDADGEVTLNTTLGEAFQRRVVGVTPTADGGALIGGSAETRGFAGSDPWVARVGADGVVRWSRTYGTTDRAYPRTAVGTSEGLLLLHTRSSGTGERRTVLTHVTADGTVGSRTIPDGPGVGTPVPTAGGEVDLYGYDIDRENRTVAGTVQTVAMPTPAAPDWPVHDTVASNRTFYRGQNLRLPWDGHGNGTYDLYRLPGEYTEFDEPRLVRRIDAEPGSAPAFETATLPRGDYALRAAPGFWYRIDDGGYSLVESREAAAFTLDEQDVWRIQPRRTVVETFAGERLVSARVESDPGNMTARVGLTRLNGSSVSEQVLADALAPEGDGPSRVFTADGRSYGTVELRPDRNLTLDADALPAGLYELTVTGNQTADAMDPATATVVVVDERRNVSLTPANSTLTVSSNRSATTELTLSGADEGLGAIRIDAARRGPPVLRMDFEFTDAVDYRSASGGSGISRDRSTAEIESQAIRNAPNGSFVVAELTVGQEDFGRRGESQELPAEQTVTVGLTYVVDADGVPYSVAGDETITVDVVEDDS